MSGKPINTTGEVSDPVLFDTIRTARGAERAHLLGMLRVFIVLLKKDELTPDEIYSSLERWIDQRECQN